MYRSTRRALVVFLLFSLPAVSGCAGCLGFGDGDDDDLRGDPDGGVFIAADGSDHDDASGSEGESDGAGVDEMDADRGGDAADAADPDDAGSDTTDVATTTCGDSVVDPGEACDDGNTDDGDYCSADCLTETGGCGDSIVQSNEVCDDGNTDPGDYCSLDCQAETGSCGDGTLQTNESCDDGVVTQDCDTLGDGGDGSCVPPGTCSTGYTHDGTSCVPEQLDEHVHIYVDNFCNLSVSPTEIHVPPGQSVYFDWHNHSVDYEVDVWMSYGGGYTDLARGATWDEPIEHCTNINRPYQAYADISIAGLSVNDSSCPGHRFMIYCDD